jgi:hypothetical protein
LHRGYRNLLAERIHVRILGRAGQILSSYLHVFTTTTFKLFIATTWLENREFIVSLVWLFQYPKSLGCFSSTSRKSLPMGVKQQIYLFDIIDNEVDDSVINIFHHHRVHDQCS